MGACASVPKGLKAEAGAAPAPEQPNEETTAPEVQEVVEVKAKEGEKKVDGVSGDDEDDNKPKNNDDNADDIEVVKEEEKVAEYTTDKHQSVNTLTNDQFDQPKQESSMAVGGDGAEAVPSMTVKAEEKKVEEPPIYDPPRPTTSKKEENVKPSTDIAEVTKEEKKIEETTQKP